MANRGPLVGVAVLVAVLGVLTVVGGVVGVGPLASTTPADQVTDPREMIARSLQSVLDANAVHLDATVSGTVPGALAGSPGGARGARRDDGAGRPSAEGCQDRRVR